MASRRLIQARTIKLAENASVRLVSTGATLQEAFMEVTDHADKWLYVTFTTKQLLRLAKLAHGIATQKCPSATENVDG